VAALDLHSRLLGHKNKEMTEVYLDDRGFTAAEWKTVDHRQDEPEESQP